MLTSKQLRRRIAALSFIGTSALVGVTVQRQYMLSRGDLFANEYEMIKSDTNYYHSLHEQVMLSHDEKQLDARETESGVTKLRQQLVSKASGIVLEMNIGTHRNFLHYDRSKIYKFIGCDWVQSAISKCEQKDTEGTMILCDSNRLPFPDCQFDTIIDTFCLECSYDIERQYAELKRMVKPGGKILLIERGLGFWMQDNFQLMRRASVNLGARGQVYHHDYSLLVENDVEVRVLKKKRKMRGMIYYYEL